MKFLLHNKRLPRFTIRLFLLLLIVNPQKSASAFLHDFFAPIPKTKIDLKLKLIGEIIGYSYIKVMLESTDNGKRYKNATTPFIGTYYEAVSSKTFKIVGTFNSETLVWKLDCFDKNTHNGVFIGKENADGTIEGHWTSKKIIRRFYLKKSD